MFNIGNSLTIATTGNITTSNYFMIDAYNTESKDISFVNSTTLDEEKLAYICGSAHTAGVDNTYTTVVFEYKADNQDEWTEYTLPNSTGYRQYISTSNCSGTWRVKDVYTEIPNKDDSSIIMYTDHTDNVPKCEIHLTVGHNF